MILLLGASGYVGQAFSAELRRRKCSFIPLTRKAVDYTNFDFLFEFVRKTKPEFIINTAGHAPNPDVDAHKLWRREVLRANVLLPQTISRVCLMTKTPWGHVSSGNIYQGAKVVAKHGRLRLEPDLNRPEIRKLFAAHPENINGFTERDEPNFSFRRGPCNFYSGTKALAEEIIQMLGNCYLWRPQLFFNQCDESRNLLAKLQNADWINDNLCSLSQMDDFVRACLDLWERRAAFGVYNVVNPGAIMTHRIVELIQHILKLARRFEFRKIEENCGWRTTQVPQSNCVLDASKLLATGVTMRSVEEALINSLQNWQTARTLPETAYMDTESMSNVSGVDAFEKLFTWHP